MLWACSAHCSVESQDYDERVKAENDEERGIVDVLAASRKMIGWEGDEIDGMEGMPDLGGETDHVW